jgi:hypothetical protein
MRDIREGKPILNKWSNVYMLLAGVLVLVIVFLYLFTRHFE